MEDAAGQLIRRALGRHPAPRLGPTFAEDVLRRVAAHERAVRPERARARRWIAAATWLLTGAASVAVLAHVEWPSSSRALAWGCALLLVPLAYSATLWPRRFLGLLALCGGPVLPRAGDERPTDSRRHVRERG